MRANRSIRPLLVLACVPAVSLCGCGARHAGVSGTVTIRGNAPNLEGLQISFTGPDGRPVAAEVASDGSYKAVGVPVGEVRVSLCYVSPDDLRIRETAAKVLKPERGPRDDSEMSPEGLRERERARQMLQEGPAKTNPVPEHYQDPNRSGLTLVVERGKENRFDVNVQP